MVRKPQPVSPPRHRPLPGSWVAIPRRPPVSRVRESSSRQRRDPAGESPTMSVVRVGHEATPQHPGLGNRPGDAWSDRPGAPAPCWCSGRSSLGAERASEPEGDRMTAASIYGSYTAPRRSCCGETSSFEPRSRGLRPVSLVKQRTCATREGGGVWVQASTQGSQRQCWEGYYLPNVNGH
jgi:hypothetical protein